MNRVNARNTGRRTSEPWMPFYVDHYVSDKGIRLSSYAAKGLWTDMLCMMWLEPIRGVITESMEELAVLFGKPLSEIEPLLAELRKNRVYSTGAEMNEMLHENGITCVEPLPPNAFVNRRMFRAYVRGRMRAAAGRKGGNAKSRLKQNASTIAHGGNGKLAGKSDFTNHHDAYSYVLPPVANGVAKLKQTPIQNEERRYEYENKYSYTADDKSCRKDPVTVGEIIESAVSPTPEQQIETMALRAAALTREPAWLPWWRETLASLHAAEGLAGVHEALEHMANATNRTQADLKGVGAYRDHAGASRDLVRKVCARMKRHNLRWPAFPTTKTAQPP